MIGALIVEEIPLEILKNMITFIVPNNYSLNKESALEHLVVMESTCLRSLMVIEDTVYPFNLTLYPICCI